MQEKHIEQMFVRAVKKAGGKAIKFTAPGLAGMPDRLVIFRGAKLGFVELKAPGKKPRPIQQARHQNLQDYGFLVYTINHPTQIPEVINAIQAT